jgi:hypothetical protein
MSPIGRDDCAMGGTKGGLLERFSKEISSSC